MKKCFFPILILLVSFTAGYHILSIWRGACIYKNNLSVERILKSIQIQSSNPDPFYRLGLFYQWDIRNRELKESLKYLKKAIERNPLEQEYWINLAKILHRMGEKGASEEALAKAILVFPNGYRGRWVAANLLLQQGTIDNAIPHFTYILAYYPNQTGMVYDVLLRAIRDTDFILEKVVPKDPSSLKGLLKKTVTEGLPKSVFFS